jgi:hypothetical protein
LARAQNFIEKAKQATANAKQYEVRIHQSHQAAYAEGLTGSRTPPPLNQKDQWFVDAFDMAEDFEEQLVELQGYVVERFAGLNFNLLNDQLYLNYKKERKLNFFD